MKRARTLPPTLRVDALGTITAVAITALAIAVVIGPRLFAPAPTHAQQQAELDSRMKKSQEIERLADQAQRRLAEIQSQSVTSVKLKPVSITNQRLVEIDAIATPNNITITRLIPGILPPPPSPAPTPSAASSSAAPATPEPPPIATIVPIKIAGSGTYPDISRFLRALHDEFRDTALSSLKLSTALEPKQSENPVATFSIDLSWYAAPDTSEGGQARP